MSGVSITAVKVAAVDGLAILATTKRGTDVRQWHMERWKFDTQIHSRQELTEVFKCSI